MHGICGCGIKTKRKKSIPDGDAWDFPRAEAVLFVRIQQNKVISMEKYNKNEIYVNAWIHVYHIEQNDIVTHFLCSN